MSKIVFLPSNANTSDDTHVIFQHAQHLQKLNHEVVVALASSTYWYPAIQGLQFISIEEAEQQQFDIAIFTWWEALFSFEKINASAFAYFVQSIEPRYYDAHETFIKNLIDNTQKIGLPIITTADDFALSLEKIMASATHASQSRIQKNMSTYLKEQLDVVFIKDEHQTEKKYSAERLHDSGYYVLAIPVSAGLTQISIALGKKYSRVEITHIDLMEAAVSPPVVQCNIDCFQMSREENNVFACKSTSGMLILNINLQEVEKRKSLKYMLRVEFHPLAVWEEVSSDVEV